MSPIERAVAAAGGKTRLANAIGVSPSFVSQLLAGERPIPATRCAAIETAVNGAVTRAELRPDIFGEATAA